MIQTISISKFALISALSISGLQYSNDLPKRMTDEQATSVVSTLLSETRRESLQEILSMGTLESLSGAQKAELDALVKEAGLHLAGHEKPLA